MAASRRFTDIARDDLERLNFRLIRTLRDEGLCCWLLVRYLPSGALHEVEAYDKALTNASLLLSYRNRCRAKRSLRAAQFRLPQRDEESDRGVYLFRPYLPGEPLHRMLLRPGRVNARKLRLLLLALCPALRQALAQNLEKVADLVPNLYVTSRDGMLIDALTSGPWLTVSQAQAVFTPFNSPELPPIDQARRFAILLFVRLATGTRALTPSRLAQLQAGQRLEPYEHALLKRHLAHPNELFWIDARLRRGRGMRSRTLVRVAASVLVIALLLGANALRHRQAAKTWQGEAAVLDEDALVHGSVGPAPASKPAPDQTATASAAPRLRITETAKQIDRLIRAGEYQQAGNLAATVLATDKLSEAEEVLLTHERDRIGPESSEQFRRLRGQALTALAAGDYKTCETVLNRIDAIFAADWARSFTRETRDRMRREQTDAIFQAEQQLRVRRQAVAEDREKLRKLRRLSRPYASVEAANALRRAGTWQTDDGVFLSDCLTAFSDAERRLFQRCLETFETAVEREPLRRAIGRAVGSRLTAGVDRINSLGVFDKQNARLNWDELTPREVYAVFRDVLALTQPPLASLHLDLYSFAISRNLPQFAAVERAELSPEQQAAAAKLAPFAERWAAFVQD